MQSIFHAHTEALNVEEVSQTSIDFVEWQDLRNTPDARTGNSSINAIGAAGSIDKKKPSGLVVVDNKELIFRTP